MRALADKVRALARAHAAAEGRSVRDIILDGMLCAAALAVLWVDTIALLVLGGGQ